MILNYLKSKPACKLALCYIFGLIAAKYTDIPPLWLFCASLGFVLLFALLFILKMRLNIVVLVLAILTTAMLRYEIATTLLPSGHIAGFVGKKGNLSIHGRISNFPVVKDSLYHFELDADRVILNDTLVFETQGRIIIKRVPECVQPEKGDELIVRGKLRKPRTSRNPGEFNYAHYLMAQHIYGFMYIRDSTRVHILSRSRGKSVPDKIRETIDEKISAWFSGQSRAILKGLLIGERGEITFETREAFSISGTMHVLAVSGLHVGFIVLIFVSLFRLVGIRFHTATVLTIICTILYASVIGFKPPVVRASTVIILFLAGKLLMRRSHPINLLSAAAILILMLEPLQLFQVSFQLSFIAVLSIFMFHEKTERIIMKVHCIKKINSFKVGGYLVQLFIVSISVSFGTLPITALYFERIPVLSVFVNIVIVPLTGLIILLGFSFIILSLLYSGAAGLIATACHFSLQILINVVAHVSELDIASISIYQCEVAHVLLTYIAILLISHPGSRTVRKASVFYLLVVLNIVVWNSAFRAVDQLEVIFFDIGQGDAALFRTPDSRYFLIDAGNSYEEFTEAERHILPYLKRQGIDKIHGAFLSHADNDHIGGLPYLMRHIKIETIYDSGKRADSEIYQDYRHLIDSLGIQHRTLSAGDRITFSGRCGLYVLHPDSLNDYDTQNNHSLVFKLVYDEVSFLFTGDIEKEVEDHLLRFKDLIQCTVLKVAHHGSSSSSTEHFIEFAKPRHAVISVGEYNRFRHPSEKVLRRFRDHGINIVRTDRNGAVIFRTDGSSLVRVR
ncbi:MAG: DNA internalization-related competence protein ComEC/Rec2 [candidate division KSB1 bacterium]|jgi:competence protein ComEC|nr:DNA internalization-related competence protein ComEC/Rec2 [candidate division KSB1 bacterium]